MVHVLRNLIHRLVELCLNVEAIVSDALNELVDAC